MLSKWYFYEFRPIKPDDLFANATDIDMGFYFPILVRMRGSVKVKCVCHIRHPFMKNFDKILNIAHKAVNNRILLTSKEYGF